MIIPIITTIMPYFTWDHIIVYLFLLVTLLVGWYVGRKNKTIDEYALGGRSFSVSVLIMTFVATMLGGATTIGLSSRVFSDGIIMFVAASGYIIPYLFMAQFMAPRMDYFEGCLTIGDMMGQLYGERSRIATGIIGFVSSVFFVATQSLSLGIILESLLGMNRNVGIAIGGITVVAYSAFGGIKSVAFTDVIQFAVLIVMIPLIAITAVNDVGGFKELFNKVPAEKLLVFGHEKFTDYLWIFLIWGGVFPSIAASPPVVQRMLMARDKKQVASMFRIGIFTTFGFEFMVMLIGLAAFASYPEISASNALPQVVNELLPIGVKGFAVAGLLAVVMSTADSRLNSVGLLMSHDVIKPICDKRRIVINELKLVKYVTFIIGIAGMFLAALSVDVIKLAFYGWGILGLTLTIPFIAGVLGLKPDAYSFFISLATTLLTFTGILIALPTQQNLAIGWGIVANAISFFGVNFIQNGGFKRVKREEDEQPPWRIDWRNVRKNFSQALPIPKNIFNYSKQKIAKQGSRQHVLAVFCFLSYILPYLVWLPTQSGHTTTFLVLRFIGGFLCVLLLAKDYWPTWLKPFFPLCWHISLLYCLPLIATMAYLFMGGAVAWFVNIALSTFLLALLVDWLTFALVSVIGMVLGVASYVLIVYGFSLELNHLRETSAIYLVIYACAATAFIAITLTREKEKTIETEKQIIQLYAANIAHDLDNTIGGIQLFSSGLASFLKYAPIKEQINEEGKKQYILPACVYEFVENLPKELRQESERGYRVIKMMLEAVKRGSMIDPQQLKEHSLKTCVADALLGYHIEEVQRKNITFSQADDFTVFADKHALWHVLYNLLKNAHRYAGYDCKLMLWLDAKKRHLHIKDDGEGIPRAQWSKIFEPFYSGSRMGSGIGLGLCKTIIERLGGRIYCRSKQGESSYTDFVIEFPYINEAKRVLGVSG